jgi:hypothetical protein
VLYTHAPHPLHPWKYTLKQTRHLGKRVCSALSALYAQASSALHTIGSRRQVLIVAKSGPYRPPGDLLGPARAHGMTCLSPPRADDGPAKQRLSLRVRPCAVTIAGSEDRPAARMRTAPTPGAHPARRTGDRVCSQPISETCCMAGLPRARGCRELSCELIATTANVSTPPLGPNSAEGTAAAISVAARGGRRASNDAFGRRLCRRNRRQPRTDWGAKNETPQGMWSRRNFVLRRSVVSRRPRNALLGSPHERPATAARSPRTTGPQAEPPDRARTWPTTAEESSCWTSSNRR